MVLADDKNFISFALVTNGTNLGLSVQTVIDGAAATVFEEASFNEYQNPMYLRLTRTGVSLYRVLLGRWGGLDTGRRQAEQPGFQTLIGPFAGNYNATPSRAIPVVMSINWFNIL